MNLTFPQIQRVAELTTNPGYSILLDALQSHIDDLTLNLHEAVPANELQILAKWRSMKEIFEILKTVPEELAIEAMTQEGQKVNEIVNRVAHVPQTPISQDKLLRLKKMYEERTKELNK